MRQHCHRQAPLQATAVGMLEEESMHEVRRHAQGEVQWVSKHEWTACPLQSPTDHAVHDMQCTTAFVFTSLEDCIKKIAQEC